MKKNDLKTKHPSSRTPAEWDELINRYYEGLTTSEEERGLCAFLFSDQDVDSRYEEHRAVMAYTAMGRSYKKENATDTHTPVYTIRTGRRRWIAAAAVAALLLITGASFFFSHSRKEVYVAYIYGEKYTSPEIVSDQMQHSLAQVSAEETSVEQKLGEMFGELDKKQITTGN